MLAEMGKVYKMNDTGYRALRSEIKQFRHALFTPVCVTSGTVNLRCIDPGDQQVWSTANDGKSGESWGFRFVFERGSFDYVGELSDYENK